MSLPLRHLALAAATVLLLVSCGSDEGGGSDTSAPGSSGSTGSPSGQEAPTDATDPSSEGTDESDDGVPSVAREVFCDDVNPTEVGDLLGIQGSGVIAEQEPGEQVTPAPGQAAYQAQSWSCTVGQVTETSIAVTWGVGAAEAKPADATDVIANLTAGLDPKNCEELEDKTLGPGTRGVDCAGSSKKGGTGFTLVARTLVVDDALLECYLASTSPRDLDALVEAAPEVCEYFRSLVVS